MLSAEVLVKAVSHTLERLEAPPGTVATNRLVHSPDSWVLTRDSWVSSYCSCRE